MAFSDERKAEIFWNAGGRCECVRLDCPVHPWAVRCGAQLEAERWHLRQRLSVAAAEKESASCIEAVCAACFKAAGSTAFPASAPAAKKPPVAAATDALKSVHKVERGAK